MKITSVAPFLPMRIKSDESWFLVLAINSYFDDTMFDTEEDGNIEYITYTTPYGEIGTGDLPSLEVYVDGSWVFDQDFT
jgi:hypothetical protein